MYYRSLLFVLIGVFIIQNPVIADPLFQFSLGEKQVDLFVESGFDLQFSMPPVKQVKNLPEYLRDVPIHSDDAWGIPGPIPKDKAQAPWLTEIRFLKLGTEIELNPETSWKSYFDLSLNYGYWTKWGADINRRNYTNAPGTEKRGYGAALTFWTPGYDSLIPGFRTELHFDNDNGCFIGAGFRKFHLEIITGYDRYDRLEHKSHKDIGQIYETSLYLGWAKTEKDRTSDLRIGLNFNNYEAKGKYSDIDVDLNKVAFFLGVNLSWRF